MERDKNNIDMRRFFRAVRQLKWVYLAVCAAFVAGAVIYVCRSLAQVPVSAQMLIGEESIETSTGSQLAGKGSGGMAQMLKTFSVGGFSAAAVDNEVLVIGSHEVLKNTVKALNLNRSYIGKSQSGKRKMLFRNSPVSVEAPAEYFDTLSISYKVRINILDDGKADVKITKGFFGRTVAEVEGVALPAMIKSPLGNFQILRTELFDSSPYRDITVNVAGNDLVATTLYSQVTIDVATKLSDVIQIDLDYPDAELGKAIVNGIMAEYNAKRLDRIHETAVNTIKYYDERIAETLRQLEQAERKVADYRQSRSLAAPEAEAGGLMALSQQQKVQALNARNELDYYNSVVSTLRSNLDGNTLIPQIESLGDTNIVAYNRLITQRKNLERSATPEHPKMILINERLATLRSLIIENSEKLAAKARKDVGFQFGIAGAAKSRLDQYPAMEFELSSMARDQNFQASLYQFLVQSRENAVLKMYADTDVGYVFQPAYVKKAGLPLRSIVIVVAALLFGIVCVTFLALILMWLSVKVRQPMDLAFMGIDSGAVEGSDKEAMARMRTKIMSVPDCRIIYTADFCGSEVVLERLVGSFAEAGQGVETISVSSNADLLGESVEKDIETAASEGNYVFVRVPSAENVFEIENRVDRHDACLLVVVPKTMRRSALKKILSGQSVSKVFTVIS